MSPKSMPPGVTRRCVAVLGNDMHRNKESKSPKRMPWGLIRGFGANDRHQHKDLKRLAGAVGGQVSVQD
ncbi:hypothetical protein ORS3428_18380 [Mesorhizobium sp. ORS 3428]|nr:hypothetical protein ORS3428_18380 [Mesorhizobium sp. ORS 3428]